MKNEHAVEKIEAMNKISRLLAGGKFTDFTIKCEDKIFPCSSILLAATSDVFQTMLCSEMKDAKERVYEIKDVTSEAVEICTFKISAE